MGTANGKGVYDYPNPAYKNPDFLKIKVQYNTSKIKGETVVIKTLQPFYDLWQGDKRKEKQR